MMCAPNKTKKRIKAFKFSYTCFAHT